MTVADLGEFGLIAAIKQMLPTDPTAVVGVGDDAAVLAAPDGRTVASTDLLIEGRHFRRDWSSARDIGVKAAAQNLADLAAMGAAPTALLFGLAVPAATAVTWVLELTGGLVTECERGGAVIAGGDVTGADAVMLGITALGTLAGRAPVTRGGARPGDVLALCGAVGRSAAGLAVLQAGLEPGSAAELADLVAAHRRPRPDYRAGPMAAAAGATAMIDVSDGLVADLGHVAAASGVRIDVRSESLATASLRSAAGRLGADWRDWALGGGEDHALAASFPPEASLPPGWTVIGHVLAGNGVAVDARPWHGRGGWDHFLAGSS
ncbi:MAG: thiamine-phosphate kinase [Streptosporangiaceae bacterium]